MDGPVPDDYDAVVKRCGKIFKTTSAENAMERFYKREKKPDERYSTLVSDLRSLLDIAKPTPVCGDEEQAALIKAAKEEKDRMIKSRLKHAVPKKTSHRVHYVHTTLERVIIRLAGRQRIQPNGSEKLTILVFELK